MAKEVQRAAKQNPRRRRRRNPRRKNMKTSTAILIGVGVLVGVPILLVGLVAYAGKKMLDRAMTDPTMLPLSGSANGYRWSIDNTSVTGLWNWEVDTSAGVEVASGAAGTLDGAKQSVLSIISGKQGAST